MKKLIFALLAVLTVSAVLAQDEKKSWDDLNGLLFPKFTEGTVYFKNGRNSKQVLNYDPYMQRLMFIQNGELLFVGNLDDINYVVIDDRIFVHYMNDVFFEQIGDDNSAFFVNYRTIVKETELNSGFGGAGVSGTSATSSTSNIMSMGGLRGHDSGGARVGSVGPGQVASMGIAYSVLARRGEANMDELEQKQEYFLYKNGTYKMFKTVGDVGAFFGHKKEIREFARDNKIDFNDIASIQKLIEYAASL